LPGRRAYNLQRGRYGKTWTGEPWLTRLRAQEISSLLTGLGFSEVFHLTQQHAQQRYFSDRADTLRAPRLEQMFAAIV
jgi:O-methyltransferase involved in polyketide biosynthesis